jgi:hypothetical protein
LLLYFQELATLKKSLEEDAAAHETAIAEMRHKYSQDLAIINEQMETVKKVGPCGVAVRPLNRRQLSDEMGRPCSMYGEEKAYINGFVGESWRKESTWKT